MTDDDEELDWEEFQHLSEAQLDALEARLMKEYLEMIERMSPRQLYNYRRRREVELCLKHRHLIKEFSGVEMLKKMLRNTQRRLVEARMEYRTGTKIGHG